MKMGPVIMIKEMIGRGDDGDEEMEVNGLDSSMQKYRSKRLTKSFVVSKAAEIIFLLLEGKGRRRFALCRHRALKSVESIFESWRSLRRVVVRTNPMAARRFHG
jgi:hypothetical protein